MHHRAERHQILGRCRASQRGRIAAVTDTATAATATADNQIAAAQVGRQSDGPQGRRFVDLGQNLGPKRTGSATGRRTIVELRTPFSRR